MNSNRTAAFLARSKFQVRDFLTTSARSISPTYFNPMSMHDVLAPSVLIIGAQRAGTTSLHEYLSRHPQLFASKRKEVHFFDVNYQRGLSWYFGNFPTKRFVDRNVPAGHARHSFETTPYYLYHPAVPSRVHRTLPDCKIIALFRNPISRAVSHYQNEVRKGCDPLSFEDAVAAEAERLQGETERLLADDSYYSYAHQHHSYIDRGRYDIQVRRWLEQFPRERLLFLRSEDLFEKPLDTMRQVTDFLAVDPIVDGQFETLNQSRTPTGLSAALRARLGKEFAPHVAALSGLTGLSFDWAL